LTAEVALKQVQGDLDRDRDAKALNRQQVCGRELVLVILPRAASPEKIEPPTGERALAWYRVRTVVAAEVAEASLNSKHFQYFLRAEHGHSSSRAVDPDI
jgi:hypothetical protein